MVGIYLIGLHNAGPKSALFLKLAGIREYMKNMYEFRNLKSISKLLVCQYIWDFGSESF